MALTTLNRGVRPYCRDNRVAWTDKTPGTLQSFKINFLESVSTLMRLILKLLMELCGYLHGLLNNPCPVQPQRVLAFGNARINNNTAFS